MINPNIKIKHIKRIVTDNTVTCLKILKDGKLAATWSNGKIAIYTFRDRYRSELGLKKHQDAVNYISQLDNGQLLSCSDDCSIRIWDLYSEMSYEVKTIFQAHAKEILKIIPITNNRMASCSND